MYAHIHAYYYVMHIAPAQGNNDVLLVQNEPWMVPGPAGIKLVLS